jgi:cellulose synthase/poly-beta-1,6-N-acetylglucosamine synthase-like glycosyltransferase
LISLLLLKFRKKTPLPLSSSPWPSLSLIVAAYNEEDIIEEKIKNCLELEYDSDKLEIIFVTDGSSDSTPEMIRKYSQIKLLHEEKRSGKAAAVNRAVHQAQNEILVFCDANTFLNPGALKFLAQPYADPSVGGVSGEKKIRVNSDSAASGGEGFYWKYESFLKKMDSRLLTIVGAAGELFSVRKSAFVFIEPDTILDDFVISLRINLKGYRILYEPRAFAEETSSESIQEEKKRKVRITAGGFQSISRLPQLWKFWNHPTLSFLYISHRVLRWTLCPLAIIFLLLSNIILVFSNGLNDLSFYFWVLVLQTVFYLFSSIGWILSNSPRSIKIFYIPYYFLFMNLNVFQGFILFLKGSQSAVWDKSKRSMV